MYLVCPSFTPPPTPYSILPRVARVWNEDRGSLRSTLDSRLLTPVAPGLCRPLVSTKRSVTGPPSSVLRCTFVFSSPYKRYVPKSRGGRTGRDPLSSLGLPGAVALTHRRQDLTIPPIDPVVGAILEERLLVRTSDIDTVCERFTGVEGSEVDVVVELVWSTCPLRVEDVTPSSGAQPLLPYQ